MERERENHGHGIETMVWGEEMKRRGCWVGGDERGSFILLVVGTWKGRGEEEVLLSFTSSLLLRLTGSNGASAVGVRGWLLCCSRAIFIVGRIFPCGGASGEVLVWIEENKYLLCYFSTIAWK